MVKETSETTDETSFDKESEKVPPPPPLPAPMPKKKRLVSLDTFRGFSITFMIFANYGGAEYWFFGK